MILILVLFLLPLLTTIGQLCFKKGLLGLGDLGPSFSNIFSLVPRIFQSGWLMAGMFIFVFVFLFYLFILSKFQLNILYPVLVSAGVVMISLSSWLLLKEPLSLVQVSGIIVIIFGIFLLMPKG